MDAVNLAAILYGKSNAIKNELRFLDIAAKLYKNFQ